MRRERLPLLIRVRERRTLHGLRGLGRFEEAHKALRRAQKLAPQEGLILTNLACVLTDIGQPAEAMKLHERAIRLMPGDPRPLGHAGTTWLALGDEVKAREAWTAALQIDPQNADALAGFEKLRGSSAAPSKSSLRGSG